MLPGHRVPSVRPAKSYTLRRDTLWHYWHCQTHCKKITKKLFAMKNLYVCCSYIKWKNLVYCWEWEKSLSRDRTELMKGAIPAEFGLTNVNMFTSAADLSMFTWIYKVLLITVVDTGNSYFWPHILLLLQYLLHNKNYYYYYTSVNTATATITSVPAQFVKNHFVVKNTN